jgi:hypothetical protein
MTIIGYNVLGLAAILVALLMLRICRTRFPWSGMIVLAICLAVLAFFGALFSPIDPFGKLQLLTWAIFLHFPLFLLGSACVLSNPRKGMAFVCTAVALAVASVGIYAFLVEPRLLETTHITIPAAKLKVPIRIAVIADIQMEYPGPYERETLRRVQAEEPDVILFLGDYVQALGQSRYTAACKAFNKMLHEVNLQAPLGVHAVRGNVDRARIMHWYFSGLNVRSYERSRTVDLGPLTLTGLSWEDSLNKRLSVRPQSKYHVIFGHHPNFSLGNVHGNLLLAGHTHGGQVRLPYWGPILTLSRVPHSWAAGTTRLAPDKTLIVSRGIGMERGNAPRMRLYCRPEIVIVDLLPGQ